MKYMLLIRSNQQDRDARSVADRDQMQRQVTQLLAELTTSGEFVGGDVLADPAQTVTARSGVAVTTGGQFIAANEHVTGYVLLECESRERAIEIAALLRNAEHGSVELRPVMTTAGLEM